MKSIIAFAFASVALAADCQSFGNDCSSHCQTAISQSATSNCTDFASSCSCSNVYSLPQPLDTTKTQAYCSSQNTSCSTTVCGSNSLVSSFSCDSYNLISQCLCNTNSNLQGGEMLGANETACAKTVAACAKSCGDKGIEQNSCSDPKTAVCQCKGESAKTGDQSGAAYLAGSVFALVASGFLMLV